MMQNGFENHACSTFDVLLVFM